MNIHNILILGEASSGKTSSLSEIPNQENWLYINTEAGKFLPFKNKYTSVIINDPDKLTQLLTWLIQNKDKPEELSKLGTGKMQKLEGIIIDSISELMKLYQSKYIIKATDRSKAFRHWDNYGEYLRDLVQKILPSIGVPYIMLCHTILRSDNDGELATDAVADIKATIGKTGLEAYFTTVVAAKNLPLATIKAFGEAGDGLTFTPEEEQLGSKYVFQLKPLPGQPEKRLRGFKELLQGKTPFIDNNVEWVLRKIKEITNND